MPIDNAGLNRGDLIYYNTTRNAVCTNNSTSTDLVVALSRFMMDNEDAGYGPNVNCGKHVVLFYDDKTEDGVVVDVCDGCVSNGLERCALYVIADDYPG
jgi:hypothetical protein